MFNSLHLEIKDKACQRAGVSPVLHKYSCWFAALAGLFKNSILCEPTRENQSGHRIYVA
jgi:hypothetical protein